MVALEFGTEILNIAVPPGAETLSMGDVVALSDPAKAVEKALNEPIGSPTLEKIVRKKHDAGADSGQSEEARQSEV